MEIPDDNGTQPPRSNSRENTRYPVQNLNVGRSQRTTKSVLLLFSRAKIQLRALLPTIVCQALALATRAFRAVILTRK